MKLLKRALALFAATITALTAGSVPVAAEPEGIPTYELVRFSGFERAYNRDTGDLLYGDTLYANWTRADQIDGDGGYDLQTAYPGRENLRLKVTLELSSTEASVDPDTAWDSFTVKLRSPDVKDKEGDPNLEINGGNDETNAEHNYGWVIRPEAVDMQNGRLLLSIPLDRPADTARGLMDWTMVQRIILTLRLKDSLIGEGLADTMTMTLSEVRIVNDVMQITRDQVTGAADDAFLAAADYREDTATAFADTRDRALALVAEEAATLQQLRDMLTALEAARQQLVEITYAVADFSRLCGTYPGEDGHTLYADWVYAREAGDGVGLDLTTHDPSQLMLQVEFTLTGPEGYDGVWNTDGWILLRSADTETPRTYGFRLAAGDAAVGELQAGVNRLSIPLDVDGKGYTILQSDAAIDWTSINRLQLYIQPEDYQKGGFSITVTMARIVDVTRPAEALDGLTAAATGLTAAMQALEEKPPFIPGDTDGNGLVEAADALRALQAATNKITLSGTEALAADPDGDGSVTAGDALRILQYATQKIAGLSTETA